MTAPKETFLSREDLAAFATTGRYRIDTPAGETPICKYCGAETKMPAYTSLQTGSSWPACCGKSECLDKWEPL